MNLMIVHPAIQNELIPGRPLEGEARPPVLVVTLREGESSLREINGGAIRSERIVCALKGHRVGVIEDGAPPTGGISEQWRGGFFVDGHLFPLPNAIRGGGVVVRRSTSSSPPRCHRAAGAFCPRLQYSRHPRRSCH